MDTAIDMDMDTTPKWAWIRTWTQGIDMDNQMHKIQPEWKHGSKMFHVSSTTYIGLYGAESQRYSNIFMYVRKKSELHSIQNQVQWEKLDYKSNATVPSNAG